ncbi:hypothetical protein BGW36DRAFT_428786 [Talaromyces proteolyticus]|uniref:Uncharacterized protein n=1 Tax=Talaromyces proteolyticus TaxID=1131652 RepID=A0AAD4KNN2_9EURO|nr:uncharacterized protein BGW36DRAFT_428786 [Talaromyces proteolyticus]KAH8694883.1 hypothetical protein BGW36DRAFT_428786 [Talaromyces proteolyticus]
MIIDVQVVPNQIGASDVLSIKTIIQNILSIPMASTTKSDIIISIRQPHLDHIVCLKKNHEFRAYLLPSTVTRFWIYEPSPVSAIKYIAEVSNGKRPGEVVDGGFIRNSDFNQGKLADGKFAYEILTLEALESPITLLQLKANGWLAGAPQKYCYVKEAMALSLRGVKTTAISSHSSKIWPNDAAVRPDLESQTTTRDLRSFFPKATSNSQEAIDHSL